METRQGHVVAMGDESTAWLPSVAFTPLAVTELLLDTHLAEVSTIGRLRWICQTNQRRSDSVKGDTYGEKDFSN